MNEQTRAAFHEAGHGRIAHAIDSLSVHSLKIFADDHGWKGEANIALEQMDATQKAAIALAGLLSEARAVAMESDVNRQIATGANLTTEIGRVIGIAVGNRLECVPANIPTTIAPAGIQNEPAILTLEDIQYVDDEIADDDQKLGEAIDMACAMINSRTEWATIRVVADRLVEIQPDAIDDYASVIAPQN